VDYDNTGGSDLKILQISSLFPPHIGGIEQHVWSLSNRLAEEGHEVTVYTSNISKLKKFEIVNGVKIFRFSCFFSPLNNQFLPGLFFKLISKNGFDIVHVHSHMHISSNIAFFSNIFRNKPIVLTSHGTVTYSNWKNIVNVLYNKTMTRWMLKSADKVIALSPTQAVLLESLGANSKNMTIIPNWIDLNKNKSKINSKNFKNQHRLNNKKIILFVGGLIQRKGINYLIDAMKYVDSDSILLIVGGEIHGHKGVETSLKEQVKMNNLKNVLFLGRISKEQLECAYSVADIFIIPSLSEGLPFTLLEAMSYKKCVIAADIPGISDVIRNDKNGILFEPRNATQLGEKINYILKNHKIRKKLGENAREDIEKKYSFEVNIKKIIELYEEIYNC